MSRAPRLWVARVPLRGYRTVLVPAATRAEAQAKLRACDYTDDDSLGFEVRSVGTGRVVREDKPR